MWTSPLRRHVFPNPHVDLLHTISHRGTPTFPPSTLTSARCPAAQENASTAGVFSRASFALGLVSYPRSNTTALQHHALPRPRRTPRRQTRLPSTASSPACCTTTSPAGSPAAALVLRLTVPRRLVAGARFRRFAFTPLGLTPLELRLR